MSWFEIDKTGLASILERRGKSFALFELLGNAWDSDPSCVRVVIEPIQALPYCRVSVVDDGEGFDDLDHSFTMFAKSSRAGNAEKRGRFNLGDKLVLSICRKATIATTSGTMIFDGKKRRKSQERMTVGSCFEGEMRMTRDEMNQVINDLMCVIPPVKTIVNGNVVNDPSPIKSVEVKLPTEIADDNGNLRRSVRKTNVVIYQGDTGVVEQTNPGTVFEMGIPVCEIDAPYDVNVMQKIPLTMDRDSITQSFRRAINVTVMNAIHDDIDLEQSAESWANEALSDSRITKDAAASIIRKRFGDKVVSSTPNDPIANAQAAANGFTVVAGGSLPGNAWSNVRKLEIMESASRAFPGQSGQERAEVADAQAGACPLCGK